MFVVVLAVVLSVLAGTSWYLARRLHQGLSAVVTGLRFWPVLTVICAIVLLLVFTGWPIINTLRMAFLEGYRGLTAVSGQKFPVGIGNFVKVLQYKNFLQCLKNTCLLCVLTVPISPLLALLIAKLSRSQAKGFVISVSPFPPSFTVANKFLAVSSLIFINIILSAINHHHRDRQRLR